MQIVLSELILAAKNCFYNILFRHFSIDSRGYIPINNHTYFDISVFFVILLIVKIFGMVSKPLDE